MNIRKSLLTGCAAFLTVVVAGGTPVLSESFDRQIAGAVPSGWNYFPRRHADGDFRYVSNVECVSAPNSLLFDFDHFEPASRGAKARTHHYFGVSCRPLPETGGAAELSFCTRVANGSVQLEILARNSGIVASVRVGEFLWIHDSRWQCVLRLGPLQPHVWYRAVLTLPAWKGTPGPLRARLERRKPDGTFSPVETRETGAAKINLKGPYFQLRFTGEGKAKLYFDDLKLDLDRQP